MSQYKVIGIAGPSGSGKDTAADFLLERLPHEYRKLSFAGPLKEMIREGLGLTHDQLYGSDKDTVDERYGVTPRRIMQTLGTEWGRKLVHPDVWVKAMESLHALPGYGELVIPDVRFENEANFIREHGKLIHIVGRNDIKSAVESHVSEAGLTVEPADIIIQNKGNLNEYVAYLSEAIKYL